MKRLHTISAAIELQPERFDLPSLLHAAGELITASPQGDRVERPTARQVALYAEQGLIDGAGAAPQPYGRRHLLQLVAVQTLRAMALDTERIRKLVQGMDDSYLKTLCDEPEEAEKKAAVMSNWLNMLQKGRVGRPERGETHLLNAPEVEKPEPLPPPPPPAAKKRRAAHGVAPSLDLGELRSTTPGRIHLPQGEAPRDLPTSRAPADLPDGPPKHQPRTRPMRAGRPTMAASTSLSDALRDQLRSLPEGATPQFPAGAHLPRRSVTVSRELGADDAPTADAPGLPQMATWTRMHLADGVELHTRTDRQQLDDDALEALLTQLRALLGR